MRFQLWLYKLLKPWFEKIEFACKRELRKARQLENLGLGLKKLLDYRAKKTPELIKALRRQPPIGGCSHRKGWRPYLNAASETNAGGKFLMKDYNVSMHTFPNAKTRIRCNRCGETKWRGEPGYEEFLKLVQQSTNKPSSSEVMLRR
jgi:hypothetical protein